MPPQIPDPTTPTSAEIFEASKVKWNRLKIRQASDLDDDLIGAAAYLVSATGRYWSDWPAPTTFPGVVLTGAPEMIPLMNAALRMRVEQVVIQAQPGYTDTAADDLIQSMSVGPYSETRRDTASLRGGRNAQKPLLNTHPGIQSLIEALQTDERWEFWLVRLGGGMPPEFIAEEVDWTMVGKDVFAGRAMSANAPWTMWVP